MGHVLPIAILLDANCSEYSENDSDQKCLACKDNYSFVNGNCIYSENTIKIKFEYTENIIDICPNNYIMDEVLNICVRKTYDQTSSKEFKDQILNNISVFVNSSELINGYDFIKQLKTDEMYADIPLIIISSTPKKIAMEKLEQNNIDYYISKDNFNQVDFIQQVKTILTKYHT